MHWLRISINLYRSIRMVWLWVVSVWLILREKKYFAYYYKYTRTPLVKGLIGWLWCLLLQDNPASTTAATNKQTHIYRNIDRTVRHLDTKQLWNFWNETDGEAYIRSALQLFVTPPSRLLQSLYPSPTKTLHFISNSFRFSSSIVFKLNNVYFIWRITTRKQFVLISICRNWNEMFYIHSF